MKILKANLDGVKEKLRKDMDWLHLVVGYEGVGKSCLGIQICQDVDSDFDVSRIVFSPMEFMEAVHRAKPYQAILCDEGVELLFTRKAMHREQVDIIKTLTQIRAKNLFICICIPDLFLIDSYIRGHRIKSMTRIVRRGVFAFFSKKRTGQIYRDPEMRTVKYPQPNFYERFKDLNGSKIWDAYLHKKGLFVKGGSAKIWDLRAKRQKQKKKKGDWFTINEWSVIEELKPAFIRNLIYRYNYIPKKYLDKSLFGEVIIHKKGMDKALNKHKKSKIKRKKPKRVAKHR